MRLLYLKDWLLELPFKEVYKTVNSKTVNTKQQSYKSKYSNSLLKCNKNLFSWQIYSNKYNEFAIYSAYI